MKTQDKNPIIDLIEALFIIFFIIGILIWLGSSYFSKKQVFTPEIFSLKKDEGVYTSSSLEELRKEIENRKSSTREEKIKEYILEVEKLTNIKIPENNLSEIDNSVRYGTYINEMFVEYNKYKNKGLQFEMVLFLAQIDEQTFDLLPLSEGDELNILEISKKYLQFSEFLKNKKVDEKNSVEAKKLMNVSLAINEILPKIVEEKDLFIVHFYKLRYFELREEFLNSYLIPKSTQKTYSQKYIDTYLKTQSEKIIKNLESGGSIN